MCKKNLNEDLNAIPNYRIV